MDRCKLIETFFSFFFTSFFTLIRSHSNREIDRFKSVPRYYIIKLVICKKRVRGGEVSGITMRIIRQRVNIHFGGGGGNDIPANGSHFHLFYYRG